MNDDFDIRVIEETMSLLRGLALERAVSVSDIVREALDEYLYTRSGGAGFADVIRGIERALYNAGGFMTSADLSALALTAKSPIRYAHRPELKYEVRIFREDPASLGALSVALRSHDMSINRGFAEFVGLWMEFERRYLARSHTDRIFYQTDVGYFSRGIYRPERSGHSDGYNISEAISGYISVFDELLKYCLSHSGDAGALERLYYARLRDGRLTI